jgi:parallel beta-helix repeat protein
VGGKELFVGSSDVAAGRSLTCCDSLPLGDHEPLRSDATGAKSWVLPWDGRVTEPSRGSKRRNALYAFLVTLACIVFVVGNQNITLAKQETPSVPPTCTDSMQAKIDSAPPGGIVEAEPCIYREQLVLTKPITLQGQPGSEIRGSAVWEDWEERGGYWQSKQTLPEFPQTRVKCMPGTRRCLWPEQVFLDGEPLRQVADNPGIGEFSVDLDRKVILRDDPKGHCVEVTVRRYWILGRAEDVSIRGFTMRHAANGGRTGAIMNRMSWLDDGYANWTVQDNVLSDAHGAVVSLKAATGLKILDNEIYRGGQLGIKSTGQGEVITGNEIHHNNTERFDWKWEAGGLKTSYAEGVIVDANEFYENEGNAVWFDVDCSNNIISNNRIHHNARHGIQYEISQFGEINGNVLWENGWGTPEWVFGSAISSANSSSMEIHRNTLAWNADGISVIGLDRDGARWDEVRDVHVYHNTILAEDQPQDAVNHFALGWLQGWSDQMFEPESNNRGQANLYWYAEPEGKQARYEWAKETYASLKAFNSTLGEEGGRYLGEAEKRRLVSEASIPVAPERHTDYAGPKKDSAGIVRALDWILNKIVSILEELAPAAL